MRKLLTWFEIADEDLLKVNLKTTRGRKGRK